MNNGTAKMISTIISSLAKSSKRQDDVLERFFSRNRDFSTSRRPLDLKPPKTFTGTRDPHVIDFFKRFCRYADFYSLDKKEKTLVFPSYLDGHALLFYENLPRHVQSNFNQLQEAFMAKFYPPQMKIFRRMKLNDRRMKADESLEDYTMEICTEARYLNLNDEDTSQIFIQGLPNVLKEHVLLSNPFNLQEAVYAAQAKTFARRTIEYDINQSIIYGMASSKTEKIEENRNSRINTLQERQYIRKTRHYNTYIQRCFRCKRTGHVARHCRAFLGERRSETPNSYWNRTPRLNPNVEMHQKRDEMQYDKTNENFKTHEIRLQVNEIVQEQAAVIAQIKADNQEPDSVKPESSKMEEERTTLRLKDISSSYQRFTNLCTEVEEELASEDISLSQADDAARTKTTENKSNKPKKILIPKNMKISHQVNTIEAIVKNSGRREKKSTTKTLNKRSSKQRHRRSYITSRLQGAKVTSQPERRGFAARALCRNLCRDLKLFYREEENVFHPCRLHPSHVRLKAPRLQL